VSYDWLKALHLIGVISWLAGLLYIFRLFVYHVENRDKPDIVATLAVMQRRLYRAICWPAMIFTTVFGVWLFSTSAAGYMRAGWFHVKLTALVLLFGYHFYAGKVRRDLAAGRSTLTARQCRALNEVPTVLMLIIVIMAVVKPF
jgi:putative membrane protein